MDKMLAQEYVLQGKTLIGQEKYDLAISFFEKAEQNDRMNIEIYLSKGLCYANTDNFEKAREEFQKALKINRKSGIALFHLGNIAMLTGEKAEGLEYYNNAIACGYDDAQIFFTLGLYYEEDGNDELAMRNYVKAIHKDPTRPDARIRKVRMLIKNGDVQQALQSIDELLLACPDVFEGYHLRFLLLLEIGEFKEAEETIEGALEIFPEDVGFALDKASLLVAKKQWDEAIEYLDHIENTMDIDVVNQRSIAMQKARIAADNNDLPMTIASLERAKNISIATGKENLDCEATYMLMNCYMSDNQFEKAKENADLLNAIENQNQFSIPALYYLPYILKQMGKDSEAVPLYKDAIEKYRELSLANPGNVDFYVFRILCLRDLGQYEKALELCDYLIAVQGELAEVHSVKAVVLFAAGREDEAKEEQLKATELGGTISELIEKAKS